MLEIGGRLGPYEILSTLGAGGMREAYGAWPAKLERSNVLAELCSGTGSAWRAKLIKRTRPTHS
jgi:hypothetical protein